jgi:signal transduction histidine kinase
MAPGPRGGSGSFTPRVISCTLAQRRSEMRRIALAPCQCELSRPHQDESNRAQSESLSASSLDESTRSILAGLATVYPMVVAFERDQPNRVAWLRDECDLTLTADENASTTLADIFRQDSMRPGRSILLNEFMGRLAAEDCATSEPIPGGLLDTPIELSSFDVLRAGEPPLRIALLRPASAGKLEGVLEKNQELETCVRSLSHDLRSPLVSVLGFTRLLRDEFGDPIGKTGKHFIDRIEQAGRHMERLIHDMLELARIEDTPHCPVHLHPTPVLEQLAAELKLRLDESGIELALPIDPPTLICDRTRLYQLFSNLVGNAIQHMDIDVDIDEADPSARGHIEVEIETVANGWQLAVRDNGPGIEAEDCERIFDAFQTARKPGQAKKSSGLGLAIVKKIVEAHRGRVWVESQPGQGARFVVWLPRE